MANLVERYNPQWVQWFKTLQVFLNSKLGNLEIYHFGSTSIPGAVAKPVIDLDIMVPTEDAKRPVINALAGLGYLHRGDLGITGREAFDLKDEGLKAKLPPHHLYLCAWDCFESKKHRVYRDFLKLNPVRLSEINALKLDLVEVQKLSRSEYIDGKSEMVQKITDEAFEYYSNPTNTTIRLATVFDAIRIAEIHILGWRFAYKGIISEEILNKLSVERSMAARRNGILDGSEEIYVIEKDNVVYGHLTIGKCRDSDKNESTFELWGIYIHPDFLRYGYGQQFLKFCELQAKMRGHKEIVLWVLKDNKIGRGFYEKNGYSIDGTEKFLEKLSAFEIRYSKILL